MANRNFDRKQALEKEVKDLYCEFTPGVIKVAATATLDLTTDIVLTSVAVDATRNTQTFELVVKAAAANPTDTVLVDFTGTAAAIVCTVTPNNGTNNGATAVGLDEDELAELINTGVVVGKNITLTDASSLRVLQTATGGAAATALSSLNDQVKAFAGGATEVLPAFVSDKSVGFASVTRNGAGDFTLALQDAYVDLKHAKAVHKSSTAVDLNCQIHSQTVSASTKAIRVLLLTGATATQPANTVSVLVKAELKNSSV